MYDFLKRKKLQTCEVKDPAYIFVSLYACMPMCMCAHVWVGGWMDDVDSIMTRLMAGQPRDCCVLIYSPSKHLNQLWDPP
jgi:hypothetical protein